VTKVGINKQITTKIYNYFSISSPRSAYRFVVVNSFCGKMKVRWPMLSTSNP